MKTDKSHTNEPARIVFLLNIENRVNLNVLTVRLMWAIPGKREGKFHNVVPFDTNVPSQLSQLSSQERILLEQLQRLQHSYHFSQLKSFALAGKESIEVLKDLIDTRRCFWSSISSKSLHWGAEKEGNFYLQSYKDGTFRCYGRIAGTNALVLPLDQAFYVDMRDYVIGGLSLANASEQQMQALLGLSMRYHMSPSARIPLVKEIALPNQIPLQMRKFPVKPKLVFFANSETGQRYVQLSFIYDQAEILFQQIVSHLWELTNVGVMGYIRDLKQEELFYYQLMNANLFLQPVLSEQIERVLLSFYPHFLLGKHDPSFEQKLSDFLVKECAEWEAKGWQIIVHESFNLKAYHLHTDWYSQVHDSAHHGWFEFEVGLNLDGQKINLLPFILETLNNKMPTFTLEAVNSLADDEYYYVTLPNGQQLPLLIEKIKPVLRLLTQFYKVPLSKNRLRLSYFEASDLLSLDEQIIDLQNFASGSERIKKLITQLKEFKSVQMQAPPANFQTQLRSYQQYGLGWLQFLREYQVGGILADDMGLGKTIQTLAHLALEKSTQRIKKPTLIVTPTSLVMNWWQEAKKFAPDLKVLMFHGYRRAQLWEQLMDYDVVITTYPLLIRDAYYLKKQTFYYLILDEAQVIKNYRAKSAQILLHLNADYRLCVTGTPIENHLGELWSLFNFLMPGFLGTYPQFRKWYQFPIEKENDHVANYQLKKRISPFILRRKKEEVEPDLPAKSEIIRYVELNEAQQQLYESIRLAMNEKVFQAIMEQGLARSRVTILEALMKLRQACCHPRLLKISEAVETIESSKFDLLFTLLPSLIEEGRRILLFSSFTSMLSLIEKELKTRNIEYVILTGDTQDRQTPIEKFQSKQVPLFLISLKAGGVGLNLTQADTVIHYDPWWNPAAENQATDRAHRIGQEKPVFVYKLITTGTIEEKIINLQSKKSLLQQSILQKDEEQALNVLTLEDFKFLLEA